MALLDNFNSGWLGQLINAGGGYDNPGWEILRQLAVGPRGGPIDRYLGGDISGYTADEAQRGAAPQQAPPPPADVPMPPQRPIDAPSYEQRNEWGGLAGPVYGAPPAEDMSARQRTPATAVTQADIQAAQKPSQYGPADALFNFSDHLRQKRGLITSLVGAATGRPADPNQQQTALAAFQALKAQGVPEQQAFAMAKLVAMNPKIGEELFKPPTTLEGAEARKGMFGASGGGTSVADFRTRESEAKKVGENLADYGTKINEGVRSAVSMRNTLDRMSKLSPQAYEGAGAPALQYARSLLTTYFGIPQGTVKAGEEFTALANRLTLDAAGGKLGAQFSNVDLAFMKAQFPSLAQTREGRMQLINYLRSMADRNAQVGELAQAYKKQSGGTLDGFDNYLAKWSEANPLFPGGQLPGGVSGGLNWKIVR